MARDRDENRSLASTIIAIILGIGVVGLLVGLAFSLNGNVQSKTENTAIAEDTATHVSEIAELSKQGRGGGENYPQSLEEMPLVIPEYHTVTYTPVNDGYCVVVADVENRIEVTYDSLAGGLNKSGGAC